MADTTERDVGGLEQRADDIVAELEARERRRNHPRRDRDLLAAVSARVDEAARRLGVRTRTARKVAQEAESTGSTSQEPDRPHLTLIEGGDDA
jgi:hypothetical protein